MALQKGVQTRFGAASTAGYFRIREVHWRRPEHAESAMIEVVIEAYFSQEAALAGADPVAWITKSVPMDTGQIRTALYGKVKTDPDFLGATDV